MNPQTKQISKENGIAKIIYSTLFKKGHMVNKFYFEFDGDLLAAIEKSKEFCSKRHIKHIHTTPLCLDLDKEVENDDFVAPYS